MRRRLLAGYLTLTVFVLAILEVPLGVTFGRHEQRALAAEVERDAFVMASTAEDTLERSAGADLGRLVAEYAKRTKARAVIVDLKGFSVADSAPATPGERDFSTRPEIRAALAGDVTSGVRHSQTLGTDLLYVAVPVASGGVVHGAVRITYPIAALQGRIRTNWLALGVVAVVVLLAATLVGARLAASIARPLRDLELATERLSRGELSARTPPIAGPAEVRSVADTFNHMAARLEDLVGAQQSFVADASHELRTPLTALRLRLENIEEGAPEFLREDAEAAAREASRLERIVAGLLALARIEGAHPQPVSGDAGEILEARRIAWAAYAAERGITISVDAGRGAEIWEIPGALEQMVDNLLANALDVAPAESAVTLKAARRDGMVEIHVIDHGPGMTVSQRAHAFDRFWRAPASKVDGGSGLGLAIVRRLAEASGGEAALLEAAGGGIDAVLRLRSAAGAVPAPARG